MIGFRIQSEYNILSKGFSFQQWQQQKQVTYIVMCDTHRETEQVTGTACQGAQMFDLIDKGFKATFINTFKKLKQTVLKK